MNDKIYAISKDEKTRIIKGYNPVSLDWYYLLEHKKTIFFFNLWFTDAYSESTQMCASWIRDCKLNTR